jgi:uncharacterized protein YkwD
MTKNVPDSNYSAESVDSPASTPASMAFDLQVEAQPSSSTNSPDLSTRSPRAQKSTNSGIFKIARLGFFLGIFAMLGWYWYQHEFPRTFSVDQASQMISRELVGALPAGLRQQVSPDISDTTINQRVRNLRIEAGVSPLARSGALTTVAEKLLAVYKDRDFQLDASRMDELVSTSLEEQGYDYQRFAHHVVYGPLMVAGIEEAWRQRQDSFELLLSEHYGDIGVAVLTDTETYPPFGVVVYVIAERIPQKQPQTVVSPAPSAPPAVKQPTAPIGINPASWPKISDDEVMAALNAYRATHGVPALSVHENLCTYAAKRAEDLRLYGGLDNHEGFQKDFQEQKFPPQLEGYSGRTIGENLAHQFCKNMQTEDSFVAETGTALIEWCFDSSVKGHREAQLSTQFKNVCVRHADYMYVVIFGD